MSDVVAKSREFPELWERAGQVHGHKCPSLYYGVAGTLRVLDLAAQKRIPLEHFLLEGKSKCIRDGAKTVLLSQVEVAPKMIGRGCAFTIGNRLNNIRLEVRSEARQMVNKLNESLSLEEYQRTGVQKLQSMAEKDFFNISRLSPEEFDQLLAQVETA